MIFAIADKRLGFHCEISMLIRLIDFASNRMGDYRKSPRRVFSVTVNHNMLGKFDKHY